MHQVDFKAMGERFLRKLAEASQPCAKCGEHWLPHLLATVNGELLCRDCRPAPVLVRAWTPPDACLEIPAEFCRPYDPLPGGEDSPAHLWSGDPVVLFLRGNVGSGKSHLAAAVLHRIASPGHGLFVRAPRLGRVKDRDLEAYLEIRALVVDDLGHNHGSAWQWEQVAEVLETRIDCRRPTIVTSRQTAAEIGASNASLMDRLSRALRVELPGGSRR